MFFASESDKAPVRRWPTSSVTRADADKPKHVAFQLEDGTLLHFNAGSQATADAIHTKLESSKGASEPSAAPAPRAVPPPFSPPEPAHTPEPTTSQVIKPKKSVNFAPAPPEVITTADSEDEYEETGGDEQDEVGTVLYDFAAEGEDELAVVEGETVTVVDRQGNDDWWKVRNGQGMEGVVPALYVKVRDDVTIRCLTLKSNSFSLPMRTRPPPLPPLHHGSQARTTRPRRKRLSLRARSVRSVNGANNKKRLIDEPSRTRNDKPHSVSCELRKQDGSVSLISRLLKRLAQNEKLHGQSRQNDKPPLPLCPSMFPVILSDNPRLTSVRLRRPQSGSGPSNGKCMTASASNAVLLILTYHDSCPDPVPRQSKSPGMARPHWTIPCGGAIPWYHECQ